MSRKQRTEEELCEASDHLLYEIRMFKTLARGLASGIAGQGVIHNALLESFTVHARVLLDFFYAERPKPDDVIAEDFFSTPEGWQDARPPMLPTLDMVHRRVGKEIAHLTYARQDITPETKGWPFIDIASEMDVVIKTFLEIVPRDVLGTRWDNYRRQGENEGENV